MFAFLNVHQRLVLLLQPAALLVLVPAVVPQFQVAATTLPSVLCAATEAFVEFDFLEADAFHFLRCFFHNLFFIRQCGMETGRTQGSIYRNSTRFTHSHASTFMCLQNISTNCCGVIFGNPSRFTSASP